LVEEWGVSISHSYLTYVGHTNAAWEQREDGSIVTSAAFEQLLGRLASLQSQRLLWNATLRDFLDYLVRLEKVEIHPAISGDGVEIVNSNDADIAGLALACDVDAVTVDGAKPEGVWRGNQYVFWFDLPAQSSVIITVPCAVRENM
jgi:hypothetical protein